MTHGRPPRKPRWQATPDTLVIASGLVLYGSQAVQQVGV